MAFQDCLNPFEIEDKSRLYCISSGCPALFGVEIDIFLARQKGDEDFLSFLDKQFGNQTKAS